MPDSTATNAASYTTRWDTIFGHTNCDELLLYSNPMNKRACLHADGKCSVPWFRPLTMSANKIFAHGFKGIQSVIYPEPARDRHCIDL